MSARARTETPGPSAPGVADGTSDALVTPSLGAAEARYFCDSYPNARLIILTYRYKPLYVLIR
jgi:hypothetical protein